MRRIDAPKRYMKNAYAYANLQYEGQEAIRLVKDSDFRKLMAVARAADRLKELNIASNYGALMIAVDRLNAAPKGQGNAKPRRKK
jgi:hypothetical protein